MLSETVLFTNPNEEKKPKPDLPPICEPWMRHFSAEEWQGLGTEARETFLQREKLAEMVLDMSECLYRQVATHPNRRKRSSKKPTARKTSSASTPTTSSPSSEASTCSR